MNERFTRQWFFKVTSETPGFSVLELWVRADDKEAFEEAGEIELPKHIADAIVAATEVPS